MIPRALLLILTAALVAGCAVFPVRVPEVLIPATPTPEPGSEALLPTQDSSNFVPVVAQACEVANIEIMQTELLQGDQIAWSPGGETLAYVNRQSNGWFTGGLALASGADFATLTPVTRNLSVTGDLAWSRSGDQLAFVALRTNPQIYSVFVYDFTTQRLTDLFPGDTARTDDFSGQKVIQRWNDLRHLLVAVSCGAGCEKLVEVDVVTAEQRPASSNSYKALATASAPLRNELAYDDEGFPNNMDLINWSPAGDQLVYADPFSNAWVLTMDPPAKYSLPVGLEDMLESDWSPDGSFLAVRTTGHVIIFRMGCAPEEE